MWSSSDRHPHIEALAELPALPRAMGGTVRDKPVLAVFPNLERFCRRIFDRYIGNVAVKASISRPLFDLELELIVTFSSL